MRKKRLWINYVGLVLILAACQNENDPAPEPIEPAPIIYPLEVSSFFTGRTNLGQVASPTLKEISGIALSRSNPAYIWAHQDSGDEARLYLIKTDGSDGGSYFLEGIENRDWEDMTLIQDSNDGKNYIYLGEIGDNNGQYDTIKVYRFEEPDISQLNGIIQDTIPQNQIETILLQYPNSEGQDAETLMLDADLNMFIFTKNLNDSLTTVYQANYPQNTSQVNTLDLKGTLPLGSVVSGDFGLFDSNEVVLLKSYDRVYFFKLNAANAGQGFWEAISTTIPYRLNYEFEPQGEAIAWASDGSGYYTISEEVFNFEAQIYFYERSVPFEEIN